MKQLTIQRSRWIRGNKDGNSTLYRESDKKMCCLGFYLKSCRVKVRSLLDMASPQDVTEEKIPKQARWLLDHIDDGYNPAILFVDSGECTDLMVANDEPIDHEYSNFKTERQRESAIKKLFAKQNVKVTFED